MSQYARQNPDEAPVHDVFEGANITVTHARAVEDSCYFCDAKLTTWQGSFVKNDEGEDVMCCDSCKEGE